MNKIIIFLFLIVLNICITPTYAGLAQFKPGSVLLDDETDSAFKQWIQKIFTAAGLGHYQPHIYLIVNPEVNAAASVGGNIYIFSEFLMKCDNASQFLGVMAHEVGHIAGGHVSRLDAAQQQALVPAAAAIILGGALALATGNAAPLQAALSGSSHIFERGMLKFSRTQESAADQAALTYLEKLGWPADGLSQFLETVSKMHGSLSGIDPYTISHPLTPDRIKGIHDYILRCHNKDRAIPADIEVKFQRIKAKIMAFLEPERALSTFGSLNTVPARYAKAIAYYRQGKFPQSLAILDGLIKNSPQDAYYHELKGQVLFETGRLEDCIPSLKTAATLKPASPLIKIMLAHALIERSSLSGSSEAIQLLTPVTQKYPQDYPMAWRLLATAQGKLHHLGEAALALAEEAYLKEDFKLATLQANRAKSLLKSNPKALTRAQDIISQINIQQN